MTKIERSGTITFGDAQINLREEGPEIRADCRSRKEFSKNYRKVVFKRVIQQMNRMGFDLSIPDEYRKEYPSIANNYREGKKGNLYCEISFDFRTIEVKFWQNINTPNRPDGNGRYEYNKEALMPYLMRIQMELTRRKLRDYFCNVFTDYKFDHNTYSQRRGKPGRGRLTALEWVDIQYKESWHFKGDLSAYKISDYNRKCADGNLLNHGQRVWFYDPKGRCSTGIAMYNINNMWWVVTGKYNVTNVANFDLYSECPKNPRTKKNDCLRRQRLESELNKAVKRMDFQRADLIKRILFGDQVLYHLIKKENGLYWASNYSGYTSNVIDAGKYTEEEVERYLDNNEVKVIPAYAT